MYKTQRKYEIDEFWNDCININKRGILLDNNIDNNTNKYKKGIKKNPINRKFFSRKKSPKQILTNENELNNLKSKIMSNNLPSTKGLKNLKKALIKEESKPRNKQKKQIQIDNIFINLYKKDKLSRELWTKNNNLQKEKFYKSKIKECTFRPEKSKNKIIEKKINELYKNTDIYERNIKLKQKYNEKIAFMFNEKNKINNNYTNSECCFHPNIKENKNVNKLLYDENIWKNLADNDSTKLFLLRYMKARENEFDKRERLNSPVNKNINNNFSYPKKMIRSLSQKDSLIIRKNLHKTLHSFKNLFTEEDNEKNEIKNNEEEYKKENKNNIQLEKKVDSFQWTFAKNKNN